MCKLLLDAGADPDAKDGCESWIVTCDCSYVPHNTRDDCCLSTTQWDKLRFIMQLYEGTC